MTRNTRPSRGRRRALSLVAVAVTAGVTACSGPADRGVVARVDDWTLTEERLAELLVLAQPFPLDSASVEGLARHWVGVAALAVQALEGVDLDGPEAQEAATWLERREAVLAVEREQRLGGSVVVDRLTAEVAFRVGDHRLFAHILRRVGPQTTPAEVELQRSTAERILRDLLTDRAWDDAASESEDLDTRDASGLLGLFERGELPPELDRVAFRLQPGQISTVIESPEGFHIVYRPRFDEVGELYASRLRSRQLAEMDGAADRVLVAQGRVTAARDASRRVREIARNPWDHFDRDGSLATWEGGSLTAGTAARYLVALPDEARAQLAGAPDRALEDLATSLAVRELRFQEAASRGLAPSVAEIGRLVSQHEQEVESWYAALAIEGGTGRSGLADYIERVVSRREEARELSPLFESWLLERVDWEISVPASLRSAEAARRMIAGTGPEPPPGDGSGAPGAPS